MSTDLQVLRRQVEDDIAQGRTTRALERLKPHAALLYQSAPREVVTNDAGYAIGVRSFILRAVARLPEAERREWWRSLDATLVRDWTDLAPFSPERSLLRERIVRYARESSVYPTALRESIDAAWLDGRHSEALERSEDLLAAFRDGTIEPRDGEVARVTTLAYLSAQRIGDARAATRHETRLRELVSAARNDAARAPAADGTRSDWIETAEAALARSSLSPAPRSHSFDPRASSREPVSPYRLGGTVWRDRVPETSLRRYVDERLTSRDGSPIPFADVPLPYHPASRGDVVVFQHDDRVVAVRHGASETLWTYWLERAHLPHSVPRVPSISAERVHVVHGAAIIALGLEGGRPAWKIEVGYDRSERRLAFASADELGGDARRAGEKGTSLLPVHLLGPVTVADGALFVPANVRLGQETESFVACLALDGSELWQTYLGSSRNTNYLGLGASPSPPLVVHDAVYHATNQGAVVALDRAHGDILWWARYPTLDQRGLRESLRDENRWHPGPILCTSDGELIVVAPQDSSWLLGLRARDGSIEWRYGRERESELIGHDDERAYLSGHQITAVGLRGEHGGKPIFTRALDPGERYPQGRAALVAGKILVSTRDALLHIATADGELLARDLWAFPGAGGNIVPIERGLAVIHPGGFLVYNELEAERRRTANLAVQNPHTALEKARFQLRSGAVEAGIQTIEDWLLSGPGRPEPNSELDRLHLEVAELLELVSRSAAPPLRTRLLYLRPLLELRPTRKVGAAIELGRHLEAIGDWERALEAYHRALEYDLARVDYAADGALDVPAEAYVRDRIEEIRSGHSDLAFEDVENRARRELERVQARRGRENSTPIGFTEILRVWPYTQAAADAYKALSRFYFAYENYGKAAEYLLEYLEDFPSAPDVLKTSLEAADLLYRSQRRSETKELYLTLLERFPDAVIEGVQGMPAGETVKKYIETRLADPGLRDIQADVPDTLRFPVTMLWRSPVDLESIHRSFLIPENAPPPELEGTFFTQSNEFIHCRDLETGLPRFTVALRMIPGFVLNRFVSEPYFSRSEDWLFRGAFVGSLLVVHDHRNIVGIDASGRVRWHVPFSDEPRPAAGLAQQLSERIYGTHIGPAGIYVVTSRNRLYRFDLEGRRSWARDLEFDAMKQPLLAGGGAVWVAEQLSPLASQHIYGFSLEDGAPRGALLSFEKGASARPRHLAGTPASLPDGTFLVAYNFRDGNIDRGRLHAIDPASRSVRWSYEISIAQIVEIFLFPEHPEEVVLTFNSANNRPGIAAVALDSGQESWRYEKFDARRSRLTVFRHGSRVYVIHGPAEQWSLLALELSRGASRGTVQVSPVWDPAETALGTFFGILRERRLHFTTHGVLFPDASSITYYGVADGRPVSEPTIPISRFLSDKWNYSSAVFGNRLVIIADGGDCAFGPAPTAEGGGLDRTVELVRAYLNDKFSLDTIVPLALGFFREGTADGIHSAIQLVDRSLLSEKVLLESGRTARDALTYLLDGLKEEAMKIAPRPTIEAYRVFRAPTIDGELEETWNYATRIRLASPRFIGRIPQPGQSLDWEGEEDLSAILYTGWDDENFYFALDVEDDALKPFDRDADVWLGDCLIIGLDPDADGGYRFGPRDQLMTLALTVPRRNQEKDRGEEEEGEGDESQGEDDADEEEDEDRPEGQFSVKSKDDGSGAVYEVALPWNSFRAGFPRPEATFGLSLLLIDDDTGDGATKTLSLNPCHLLPPNQKPILTWKYLVPQFFPRVVLRQ